MPGKARVRRLPLNRFAKLMSRRWPAGMEPLRESGALWEYLALLGWVVLLGLLTAFTVRAQEPAQGWQDAAARRLRAERFVAERGVAAGQESAAALVRARSAGVQARNFLPRAGSLTAAWQALGPAAVLSASNGKE